MVNVWSTNFNSHYDSFGDETSSESHWRVKRQRTASPSGNEQKTNQEAKPNTPENSTSLYDLDVNFYFRASSTGRPVCKYSSFWKLQASEDEDSDSSTIVFS